MPGHTVLVLGAGASLAYGLPLGTGLLHKICELLPRNNKQRFGKEAQTLYNHVEQDTEAVKLWRGSAGADLGLALVEFRQRLIESDPKSIDEFLSRDFGAATRLFRTIGKLAIANVIAHSESVTKFAEAKEGKLHDHWYRYLWQDCLYPGSADLDSLKRKKLRIVSFNYDRSLEYFLGQHIAATFLTGQRQMLEPNRISGWAKDGYKEVETNFDIVHPYGKLGTLAEIPYGDPNNTQDHGVKMASNIRVIGEERTADAGFTTAAQWIENASSVVFLGFSFDATNMSRLGLSNGLPRRLPPGDTYGSRQVFPLSFGLERAERMRLHQDYFPEFFHLELDSLRNPSHDALPLSETHATIPITSYLRKYGCLSNL